jgi:hypothetical protein
MSNRPLALAAVLALSALAPACNGAAPLELSDAATSSDLSQVAPPMDLAMPARDGTYSVMAVPHQQACGGGTLVFVPTQAILTITDGGTILNTDWGLDAIPGITVVHEASGPITGDTFTQSFEYVGTSGLRFVSTATGMFNSDGSFDTEIDQKVSQDGAGPVCSIKWQVHGKR